MEELGKSGTAYIKDQIGVEFTEWIFWKFSQPKVLWNVYIGNMHITRIKNTVMNVQVPIEEKPIVVKFMKDLKYLN